MPDTPPDFNLVGCGRLGRSITRLLHTHGLVRVAQLIDCAEEPARATQAFVGAGEPVAFKSLRPAAITLIATPDDAIAQVAAALACQMPPGSIVFHCSGALPSSALTPLREAGCAIASLHPLRSFASPDQAVADFAGTACGCEGDEAALAVLGPMFDAIGARRFAIDPAGKLLYHAGAVLACNHLVALMEAALRSMEAAGVPRDAAWPALRPLIEGTFANLDRVGPRAALTGPVARDDRDTVLAEWAATAAVDAPLGDVYRALSRMALTLTPPGGRLSPDDLEAAAADDRRTG
ncbi:Rossmann-like and DUF2520 domain-containing protein [Niveibacterium microcysteis]|uniref:DUF2520 domain-containing protein n=1 Tax=Niveibacterium microcysteis TaxID=2811415 RepID=A0ABX7M2J5_9RHOO|nr:Rossmann-like and DUF2520 domain-containing protein [Niveibacterium microcysteis]QSI75975.1 DUF2520 domain-containing protein [Niveibacterium microcysteis]